MLYHGSKAGAFDLKDIVLESLVSMRRAGKSKAQILGLSVRKMQQANATG